MPNVFIDDEIRESTRVHRQSGLKSVSSTDCSKLVHKVGGRAGVGGWGGFLTRNGVGKIGTHM